MSISFKAYGTYGEILVNGQVVAKLPVSGNAVIPNLVGTVSQSGGVPTGAVVERGSNANGEYVRFADGTQVVQVTINTSSVNVNLVSSLVWTFPSKFVANPVLCGSAQGLTSNDHYGLISWNSVGLTSSTLIVRNGATTAQSFTARVVAIGRWY